MPVLSSNYVSKPEEAKVAELLQKQGFVQLYGLSGIGKSQLAMSIVREIGNDYDTVLWFDGEKINANDLSSVYTQSLGESINLKTVLCQFKILLVADNMNVDVNAFIKNFCRANKKGSHCIVTSLQKNLDKAHSFQVPYVDEVISKQILFLSAQPPTKEQAEIILGQITGYPLLLDLARQAVENGNFTWEELIGICNLTGIPDIDRNMAFAERIVGQYKVDYAEMFNTIILLDSLRACAEFLKSIDVFKAKDLVRLAIFQSREEFFYQIHIVVLDAIRRVFGKDVNESSYIQYILKYLKQHVARKDAGLYLFMAIDRDMCMELAERLDPADELRHYIVLAACYTKDTYQEHDKYINPNRSLEIQKFVVKLVMC